MRPAKPEEVQSLCWLGRDSPHALPQLPARSCPATLSLADFHFSRIVEDISVLGRCGHPGPGPGSPMHRGAHPSPQPLIRPLLSLFLAQYELLITHITYAGTEYPNG